MKQFIAALALLGIMASISYADDATTKDIKAVVKTYNQLADWTTAATREVKVTVGDRSVNAQVSYAYAGKVPHRPAEVTLRFSTVNPKQVWSEVDDFIYLKFGDKVAKAPAELLFQATASPESYVVTETLTAQIPIDAFEAIFSTKEIIIGLRGDNTPPFKSNLRENYPFNEVSLAPFKELAKSIPPRQ